MIYRTVKPSDGKYILSPVDPENTESPLIFVEPIPEIKTKLAELLEHYQTKYEWYPNSESKFVMNRKFISAIIKLIEEKR